MRNLPLHAHACETSKADPRQLAGQQVTTTTQVHVDRNRRARSDTSDQASDDQQPQWLTETQVASDAQVHVDTVRRARRTGKIRYARVNGGRGIRIHRQWAQEWMLSSSEPVEVRR